MTKNVPKSTQKDRKKRKITHKYPKVRGGHSFFLTEGATIVAKNIQNDKKNTQKCRKILKITHKYPKVPKSTKKYSKVHKSEGELYVFFHRGTTKLAKNTQNDQKCTQKYSKVQKNTQNYSYVP